ncbi:hypothetical protein RSAG8_12693, partial [Rhizoctonia solani AG-8 WAC10335]
MPAPSFRPLEAELLRSQLGEWQRMKAITVNKGNVDTLLRERRQFIRQVTLMLLAKFPERDPSASDPSPLTYTQEDLERLPEKTASPSMVSKQVSLTCGSGNKAEAENEITDSCTKSRYQAL